MLFKALKSENCIDTLYTETIQRCKFANAVLSRVLHELCIDDILQLIRDGSRGIERRIQRERLQMGHE